MDKNRSIQELIIFIYTNKKKTYFQKTIKKEGETMIKELIDKITDETTITEIMPDLVEVGAEVDNLNNRIIELEADVTARDEEIRNLKESNFDLMKKIFDKPVEKDKKEDVVEETIKDEDIFDEMVD